MQRIFKRTDMHVSGAYNFFLGGGNGEGKVSAAASYINVNIIKNDSC